MKKLHKVALVAMSMAIGALQWGCSQDSEVQLIASAKASLERQDPKTATIQIKNALEKNASSGEARYLLGKVLLEGGNSTAAELELRKAKDLKHPVAEWAPLLARAMLLRHQFKRLVDEFGALELSDPAAQANLNASVAAALAGEGRLEDAKALVESTLVRNPDHTPTLMLKARLLARPGSLDEAIALVDAVLGRDARVAEAWQLRGDLQMFGKRDPAAASEAYKKVIALQGDAGAAHSSLILIYLASNDIAGARKQLEAMRKVLPTQPQTIFMDVKVAFLGGEVMRARDLVQQLLRSLPDRVAVLELAAAIELKLNSLQQAETYLNKALARSPDLPSARRMLADVLMRNGKPAKALEVLGPNIQPGRDDPLSLAQAAEAHLLTGNLKKTEEFFQQAVKLAPADPKYRTALALTQLAKGQVDAAFSELRAISASAPDTLADLTLINVLLRRKNFVDALQAIDVLQRKQPDKPLAANLRGRVQLAQRNLAGARKSFEQALEKDPVFLPAIESLAAIDQAEGKPEPAEKRYEALLKIDPKNARAYLALAALKERGGASKELVGQLLEQAVQASPGESEARLMLIHHWLSQHNMKAAQAVAQAGVAALPDNLDMLDALGSLQLVAGDVNQSIAIFSKIAAKQPDSTKAQLRLADAYLKANDYASAERSFKRVLALAPDSAIAQRGLIALSVRAKQPGRALAVARDIQKKHPADSVGYLLEGDIHAQSKDWDAAIKAYRAGMGKSNSARFVERLYAATVAGKGKVEALRVVDEWMKRHPGDSQFLVFLGNNAVNLNELIEAEKFFIDAIKANQSHATALNNLAWVKAKLGKPGAVALAERAVAMAPDDPAFLDTLAFAQAADNQLAKAVATAQAVVVKAPDEPVYRLNLAKLYIRGGDKKRARDELEPLGKLGTKFARQSEVGELLKSL